MSTPSLQSYLRTHADEMAGKYIPESWKADLNRAMTSVKSNQGKEVSTICDEEAKIIDRFFIEGTGNFTWEFCYNLMSSCRKYDFNECWERSTAYDVGMDEDKMQHTLKIDEWDEKATTTKPNLTDDYKWESSEDILSMFDYKPKPAHARRLLRLACTSIEEAGRAWMNDLDVRLRKEISRDEEGKTITTPYGTEYLYFRFLCPAEFRYLVVAASAIHHSGPVPTDFGRDGHQKLMGLWFKVGCKCALKSCNKRSPTLLKCSRCKEAHYCNREHQQMDWTYHRQICK